MPIELYNILDMIRLGLVHCFLGNKEKGLDEIKLLSHIQAASSSAQPP